MKLFGKELSGKAARDLIARLVLILVSGAVLIVSAVTTVAWFSRNTTVRDTGMQVVVKTDVYELRVHRSGEYDRQKDDNPPHNPATKPEIDIYEGISGLKSYLQGNSYDVDTEISTLRAGRLAFELENEYPYTGYDEYAERELTTYYLRPGAYGKLTFYLKLFPEGDFTLNFTLDVSGFANTFDNEGNINGVRKLDSADPNNPNDAAVLNLLKGHLLLFETRTTNNNGTPADDSDDYYTYDDLIDDGTFSFVKSDHVGEVIDDGGDYDGCYEISVYWIWPETYYDMHENINPNGISKYPSGLGPYINNNRSYFFATNQSSNDEEELSDGYNDADQKIGDNVDYIVVYVMPQ